jgi:hypothetical protein
VDDRDVATGVGLEQCVGREQIEVEILLEDVDRTGIADAAEERRLRLPRETQVVLVLTRPSHDSFRARTKKKTPHAGRLRVGRVA